MSKASRLSDKSAAKLEKEASNNPGLETCSPARGRRAGYPLLCISPPTHHWRNKMLESP